MNQSAFLEAARRHQSGDLSGALQFYLVAKESSPNNPTILYGLGVLYAQLGEFRSGLDVVSAALASSQSTPFLILKASLLVSLGRYEEAIAIFEGLPRNAISDGDFTNFATALIAAERDVDALKLLSERADRLTDDPVFHFVRGKAYRSSGDFVSACADARFAISLCPKFPEAMVLHVSVLLDLREHDECLRVVTQYLDSLPDSVDLLLAKGNALRHVGRQEEGSDIYKQVLTLAPENPEANYNLGYADLYLLNFETGWRGYQYRWKTTGFPGSYLISDRPHWTGDPVGRLLIWGEQGIGDQVLFLRFLPAAANLVGNVTVSVAEKLLPLCRSEIQLPNVQFIGIGSEVDVLPHVDAHVPIADLGALFVKSQADIENHPLPNVRQSIARRTFGVQRGPRIGICWRSGNRQLRAEKNIPLEAFLQGLDVLEEATLVCFQGDLTEDERNRLLSLDPQFDVAFPDGDLWNDLELQVSYLKSCDHVFSVSCTLAHLAGASRVSGSIIVPKSRGRFWYWSRDKLGRSIWYPSLRIYDDIDVASRDLSKVETTRSRMK
jgi:tetratricopeptide (TPR) repeat protein